MSKLTDIKYRINQLDGGDFQNLCDAYLSCKGYKNGYSLGMNTGTNKTAKGNPDTYFLTSEKKYVMVMYTTQQKDFLKKTKEDIDKCFDQEKTGISADDIAEIICCHTYGRLKAGDDKELRKYCKTHGADLTLIGIDELGNDIFHKYPFLAKDMLGISVDSGQILPPDIFVKKHDTNKMSAPLGTDFLFREKEMETAKMALHDNDVLLIAGPAGVGKTRFALELCRQLAEEKGYTVFVIKNNGLQLYEDLVSAIEEGKDYLVFVDDANELSGLHYVLDYLTESAVGSRCISKLILTVRDYARKQVMQSVMEVIKPEIIKLSTFNDDDIQKLMTMYYGITNRVYTDRIVEIAAGNARLAMLAGKLAVDGDKGLAAIQDASDLYHNYYSKQLKTLVDSRTGVCSAGIIAFIQSIHLDYLEKLDPIFDELKITSKDFVSDLRLLHEAEIVDICNDKAAKISDQSFSNFLIKYVFVEEKSISLSKMIETCFQINKNRTIEACNILLNVFLDQSVKEYVETQINHVWDKLENNTEAFLPFFKAFHMLRPTHTLSLIQQQIDQEQYYPFDVQTLELKDNGVNKSVSDDILQILSSFKDHHELQTALELLLLYYKKRPDLFEQFYSVYVEQFDVDMDSQRFEYFTQSTVIKNLCDAVEESPKDMNLLSLFVHVAGHFLKLNTTKTKGGRHGTVSFYTITIPPDEPVLEYRKMLLKQLYKIYQNGYMHSEIENILCRYGMSQYREDVNYDVTKAEFEDIVNFFSLFQMENLYHCIIAENMERISKHVDYCIRDTLLPFLNSEKYKIYSALKRNIYEDFSEGYDQGVQKHKSRVYKLVENYTAQNVDCLIRVCLESTKTFDQEKHELSLGLEYVFAAFEGREDIYLYLVEAYMKANTPYQVFAERILNTLFKLKTAEEVKEFITKYKYDQQNVWLWYFYALMPEEQVSSQWTKDLLHYLDAPDIELHTSPYRKIDLLRKYEIFEPKIIFKVLRIISNHYKESPFIFSLYVSCILNNSNQQEVDKILSEFSDELPLLEEVYLKGISYSSHEDFDGTLLYAIISVDNEFLYRYIDHLIDIQKESYRSDDYHDTARLLKIWDTIQFMDLADGVFNYVHQKKEQTIYWVYYSVLEMMLSSESNHQEIIEKQDLWIKHTIEKYSSDEERMHELFSAIKELPCKRRKVAVEKFLSLNTDPNIFERLPLESPHWGGWGSMIPYIQERIDYLNSLLPFVSGVKYLKQKCRIEKDIDTWKERIRTQEVEELLESWYY